MTFALLDPYAFLLLESAAYKKSSGIFNDLLVSRC